MMINNGLGSRVMYKDIYGGFYMSVLLKLCLVMREKWKV